MTTAIVNNPVKIVFLDGLRCDKGCPGRGSRLYTCRYFVDPNSDYSVVELRLNNDGWPMRSGGCLAAESTEGK